MVRGPVATIEDIFLIYLGFFLFIYYFDFDLFLSKERRKGL